MDKNCLYFRGKCYQNTRYNWFIGKFLTMLYLIKWSPCRFFIFFLFFGSFIFCSCSRSVKIENNLSHSDSIRCDSFEFAGHSYIEFQQLSDYRFMILHNPDCSCRYHRTFVVIKRNK